MNVITKPMSGDRNVDALLYAHQFANNNLTYSFPNSYKPNYSPWYKDITNSFEPFNGIEKNATRYWLDQYSNISNLRFTQVNSDPESTNIRFAKYSIDDYGGIAKLDRRDGNNQVWMDSKLESPEIGNYFSFGLGHEIAHALFLKHGHEGQYTLSPSRNSTEFSIMTYRDFIGDQITTRGHEINGFPQTPMMFDIAAIQHKYGANWSYNSSNTNYNFSSNTGEMFINGQGQGRPGGNRIFRTVWDGGGNDTYDFSNYSTNLSIDLQPEGWVDLDTAGNSQRSHLGGGNYSRGHIFNALQYKGSWRSLIENAKGGSGNDNLLGNQAGNNIQGNRGNDYLNGKDGNDSLWGGRGKDTLSGGEGRDLLVGGSNDDILLGNQGNDNLYGKDGDDFLRGNQGNDTLHGGSGADDFVLELGSKDTITGFYDGDRILLGSGLNYEQLNIFQSENNVIVKAKGQSIGLIQSSQANQFTSAVFDTLDQQT